MVLDEIFTFGKKVVWDVNLYSTEGRTFHVRLERQTRKEKAHGGRLSEQKHEMKH